MRPTCVFCLDESQKAGKLLNCLHKICDECLTASVQPDGRIHCAECRRFTPRPPPGRNHEQLLVDDSMFDNAPCYGEESAKAQVSGQDDPRVSDNDVCTSMLQPEPKSTHTDCNYSIDIRGCQKDVPQVGRVHFCPFHSKMELRLYCNICREVLCESCKHHQKHDSHIDQIGDITEEAVALRQRLKVRMEKFVPEGKTKEVDKSLEFAGDLLKAIESERTSQVTLNKRLIDAVCNHQHQVIKKRKQELICGVEQWRKQLADLHAKCSTEYGEACEKAKHEKCLIKAVSTNQDLLKIHPYLNKFLASTGTSILQGFPEKYFSLTSIWKFACLNLTDLEGRMSTMGVFLDDNDIDMSFKRAGTYVMFKGEQLIVAALVRTRRGQPVPEATLKDSNIKIFASKIEHDGSMAAPVRLPTSGYGEGEMDAFLNQKMKLSSCWKYVWRLMVHHQSLNSHHCCRLSSSLALHGPDSLRSKPGRASLTHAIVHPAGI